jgi:hypothetical protein
MQADRSDADADSERLDPLFASDLAEDYRSRWAAVQISFVDDPRRVQPALGVHGAHCLCQEEGMELTPAARR